MSERSVPRFQRALILCVSMALSSLPPVAEADWEAYPAISDGYVNIRSGADVSAPSIGRLYIGDHITVTGYKNGWCSISAPTDIDGGYIKAEYLTDDLDASGTYVNASGGRVRIRKTINGKPVGWLHTDGAVKIKCWHQTDDGTRWGYTGKGWICGDYLERAD